MEESQYISTPNFIFRGIKADSNDNCRFFEVHTSVNEFPVESLGDFKDYVIVDNETPIDITFQSAWIFNKSKNLPVDVESSKAKELVYEFWRMIREPLFKPLDMEFQRALETGDQVKIAEVISKKQILRDVTDTILPDYIPEIHTMNSYSKLLRDIWPACLGAKKW